MATCKAATSEIAGDGRVPRGWPARLLSALLLMLVMVAAQPSPRIRAQQAPAECTLVYDAVTYSPPDDWVETLDYGELADLTMAFSIFTEFDVGTLYDFAQVNVTLSQGERNPQGEELPWVRLAGFQLAVSYFDFGDYWYSYADYLAGTSKSEPWQRELGFSFSREYPNEPVDYELWLYGQYGGTVRAALRAGECEPKILSISAKGIGTAGGEPQTGRPVQLDASISLPPTYELTGCGWSGDLLRGRTEMLGATCSYVYTPTEGPGPSTATYGSKTVRVAATCESDFLDAVASDAMSHTYNVYFDKNGDDDGDAFWCAPGMPTGLGWKCGPNWFEYWGDDGAVPGLASVDVQYDPTCLAPSQAYYNPSIDDYIHLGDLAAETDPAYTIPPAGSPNHCPYNLALGDTDGIDTAAVKVAHERRHKTIFHSWDAGAVWAGKNDADDPTQQNKLDLPSDSLPDDFEIGQGTDKDNVDSCAMACWSLGCKDDYRFYGDEEVQCRLAEIGIRGNPARDWANPGAQLMGPVAVVAAASSDSQERSSSAGPDRNVTLGESALHGILPMLTGDYSDSARDTNGDGLYDVLTIQVGVETDQSRPVSVVAWLEDPSSERIIWANNATTLVTGTNSVGLAFDGVALRMHGADGPYGIGRVELRLAGGEVLADAADDAYTTAAYLATDFTLPSAEFTGGFDETPIDENSDGLYDSLRIEVEAEVHITGTYTLTGQLEGDTPIELAQASASLVPGSQPMVLAFDGATIFQSREDGPYALRALRIEDAAGEQVAFVYDAYATGSYGYQQFQHRGTIIEMATFVDSGWDPDLDGDYESLRLELEVSATEAITHSVYAVLRDSSGDLVTDASTDIMLAPGINEVHVDFPGDAIYKNGTDGPYTVSAVSLLGPGYDVLDAILTAHETAAYDYLDFGTSGDCNGDAAIDAGDISATILEIFDGDGLDPKSAMGGSFVGDPAGCDANDDRGIDAGDISCAILLIFNGPGACLR